MKWFFTALAFYAIWKCIGILAEGLRQVADDLDDASGKK